jgi:hypothetical protein
MKKHIILVTSVLTTCSLYSQSLGGSNPNIVLVMTDDQGPHLSYMGIHMLKHLILMPLLKNHYALLIFM